MRKHLTRCSRTEILVRLAGIEPTTPWFVAKYSIQLSYSREALHYSTVGRRILRAAKFFHRWWLMTRFIDFSISPPQ